VAGVKSGRAGASAGAILGLGFHHAHWNNGALRDSPDAIAPAAFQQTPRWPASE